MPRDRTVRDGNFIMQKILLVEDDDTIAFGIRSGLARKGYEVVCCHDIAEAKRIFSGEMQLILLDLNLPDGSGYDLCNWVKCGRDTPVIFLTVRDDVADITRGLDMGADDYITKPFHMAVLESRIQAVLRRAARRGAVGEESALPGSVDTRESNNGDGGRHILICGGIRIDTEKMQAYVKNEEISLTSLEYRLLLLLMENKGCILQRGRILESLWDVDGNFVNDNTLTVAVKRLRRKLRQSSCITTVRGIGYRMEEME